MTEKDIIKIGNEFGINELIVNRIIGSSQSIKFEDNSFSETNDRSSDEFSINAFIEGNKITKYISKPNVEDIKSIFEDVLEESKYKTKELDEHALDTSKFKYLNPKRNSFKPLTIQEAQKIIKDLVLKINQLDPRIIKKNTSATYSMAATTGTYVSTTKTNLVSNPSDNFVIFLTVFFDDKKGTKWSSQAGFIYTDKSQIDFSDFQEEIERDIKLEEKKKNISADKYEIVFEESAFMKLFSPFLGHINGRNIVDGLSKWKNKIGQKVVSSKLNLIDQPISEETGIYITYDSDGFPTKNQHFIKDGILKEFVSNQKLSNLLGRNSSGNSKGNGAGFFNPYIDVGINTKEEILSSTKEGVFARSFSGMHSGIEPLSGEFSIELEGNIIRNGKIEEKIEGSIISGNFFTDILPNIEMIANKRNIKKMESSPMIKISKKIPISS